MAKGGHLAVTWPIPSPFKRIQVLCEPDLHAAIQTIARGNMTLSATCAQMLGQPLNLLRCGRSTRSGHQVRRHEPQKTPEEAKPAASLQDLEEPTAEWAQKPGADGLSMNEKIKLINAKRAGVKDKEITEAAQQDDKESKKVNAEGALLEIMSEA